MSVNSSADWVGFLLNRANVGDNSGYMVFMRSGHESGTKPGHASRGSVGADRAGSTMSGLTFLDAGHRRLAEPPRVWRSRSEKRQNGKKPAFGIYGGQLFLEGPGGKGKAAGKGAPRF